MADDSSLTPMMIQYQGVKKQYQDEIVFFRLGDFYEMFDDDAVKVSRMLNLTLTHRANQKMCGIPYHASKIYIARLLRLGQKIVICEQVGEVPKGKGITERKVTEIITPGTAVESEYLDGYKANYLASLSIIKGQVGFAYIDITTSSFEATSWNASKMNENFGRELNRANPSELLLPLSLKKNDDIQKVINLHPNLSVSYYPDWNFSFENSYKNLTSCFQTHSLKAFGIEENCAEVVPAGFLIDYLKKNTNSNLLHINSIHIYSENEFLMIDESTRKNLEITENLRDGSQNFSLLECVNFTRTAMGSRLLRNWLVFPLTDLNRIEERQSRISTFVENNSLLEKIKKDLSSILDIERFSGRIAMDRAHAKDLQALKTSLESWILVKNYLTQFDFSLIESETSQKIVDLINLSIIENPSTTLTDGNLIKSGWSEELDNYRKIHDDFNQVLYEYESEERETTGISNLKIKFTNGQGYYIEVTKSKLASVPPHFIMRRSLVTGDRYTTQKLQQLEQELSESSTKILELERDLYIQIRDELKKYISYLLQISDEIAYVDVACSLALSAIEHNWVRPQIENSTIFEIKEGRHPVVENHLPIGEFIPNDSMLSSDDSEIPTFNLITGPNMAGKSTYLRQNALIALLAQIGSFVPCEKARIGIIDRIFCRVGASDNLAKGESTFLVEMTETANILRAATKNSLVIMDEVGRGTSTEDGLAIARAVSEYLLDTIKCRTFFATHYHELSRMEHKSLKMLCMEVLEENGSVVFLRKVKEGVTENSYGIHVAKLAGVPQKVIDRASAILTHIQSLANENPLNLEKLIDDVPQTQQSFREPNLFSDEEIIISEILSIDLDNITPMNALQTISRWKKNLSGL